MLFASESIIKARRALYAQVEAGALPREQAFRRALELDPFDFVSLMVIGEERYAAGDLEGAAEYYWRAGTADPCRFEPWFKLPACLPGESQAFRDGIQELAALKALRDPQGVEHFDEALKKKPAVALFPDGESVLSQAAEQLHAKRRDEPEEVSRRLRPYRLVDDLLETAEDGLAAELVDGILEDGARCLPLLVGVLRAMATKSLPGDDAPPAVSSLALIGEIGDPAVLPEVIECYSVDHDDIQEAAHWAVRRIASRRAVESFEVVRKLTPGADAARLCSLTMALMHFPDQPGKRDCLIGLLDGLAALTKSDRHDVFMGVAFALGLSEGTKGLELAWTQLDRYAALLPKRTRTELRDAMRARAEFDQIVPEPPDETPAPTVYDLCCPAWEDEDDEEDEDDDPFDDDDEDDFEDENEDFVPEPVRRSVNLGRNDACWCGSGKKYKKCHLQADEEGRPAPLTPEKAEPRGSSEEAELRGRLISFATEILRKREVEESLLAFIGAEPLAGGDDDTQSREALDWMIHDYVPPRLGHPMIEEFLKRNPGGLSMRQRRILETWSHARYSVFEVQEVRLGEGVRLKDLLGDGEFFVHDLNTSKWAVQWDCLLARVEEFDGRHHFTAMVVGIPRPLVAPLRAWAIDARQRSGLDWGAFLRANSHKLRQEASRLMHRGADDMRVVGFEGDELVFSRARYALLDEEAVRRALNRSKAFLQEEDPADYGWLDEVEDASGARRAYGHVHIGGGELRLECSTRQRLKRGKELLGSLAGEHLRHLDDDFTPWQSAMRDRKAASGPAKASSRPPEVERELAGKVLAEHYDRWLDMPLPALDGKTPRQAAAAPEDRARVVDLLKLLENGEEHKRRNGLAWYDVSKLKAKLGVAF